MNKRFKKLMNFAIKFYFNFDQKAIAVPKLSAVLSEKFTRFSNRLLVNSAELSPELLPAIAVCAFICPFDTLIAIFEITSANTTGSWRQTVSQTFSFPQPPARKWILPSDSDQSCGIELRLKIIAVIESLKFRLADQSELPRVSTSTSFTVDGILVT